MGRRRMVFAAVGIGLISIGQVYAADKGPATQPTIELFDNVVRDIWEKRNRSQQASRRIGEKTTSLCITAPPYLSPDARSKAQSPLAWHMDFFSDTPTPKNREHQFRQLDALVKVGLLKKSSTTIDSHGEARKVIRYGPTAKGWAASGYKGERSCFAYGTSSYLGVTGFEPKVVHNQAGIELYEVHVKTGIGSADDLAPWAKDPELQDSFPEIKENVKGREFVVLLVRGGGEWVDYETVLKEGVLKKTPTPPRSTQPIARPFPDDVKRQMAELDALPPPTVDEVKKVLEKTHGVGQAMPWPIPCLDLPGSEKLPVDKELFGRNPSRYSVAIFTNKARTANDIVATKTIPLMNTLQQLGILRKVAAKRMLSGGRGAPAEFDADIYELTPAYENRIGSRYPACLPLGDPTVEFIDVQVAEKGELGYYGSSFRYKLKVVFKNPPAWMSDPALRAGWPELRGVTEQGMACEGTFGFNRKTRDKSGGGGSCWWAFDSYYENY